MWLRIPTFFARAQLSVPKNLGILSVDIYIITKSTIFVFPVYGFQFGMLKNDVIF